MATRNSGFARKERDAYETPAWVTGVLVDWLRYEGLLARRSLIWEPAAGSGKMVSALRSARFRVAASDIFEQPGLDFVDDFLSMTSPPVAVASAAAIVSNPPFKEADEFVRQALRFQPRGLVAMLLPLYWDAAKGRREFFADCPAFRAQIVLTRRIVWFDTLAGEKSPNPSERHAWFIWDGNHAGFGVKCWQPAGDGELCQ